MDNSELVTGCKIHLVEQIHLEDVLTISNSVLFDLQVVINTKLLYNSKYASGLLYVSPSVNYNYKRKKISSWCLLKIDIEISFENFIDQFGLQLIFILMDDVMLNGTMIYTGIKCILLGQLLGHTKNFLHYMKLLIVYFRYFVQHNSRVDQELVLGIRNIDSNKNPKIIKSFIILNVC